MKKKKERKQKPDFSSVSDLELGICAIAVVFLGMLFRKFLVPDTVKSVSLGSSKQAKKGATPWVKRSEAKRKKAARS